MTLPHHSLPPHAIDCHVHCTAATVLNAVGPTIDFDRPAKVCVGKFPMFPLDSEVVHTGTPQQATIWGYSVISYRATQTKNKKQFLPVHLKCTLISHKSAMPIPEGVGSYG